MEKTPKGYTTRTSYKYDFVGNVLAKAESVTDTKNTTVNVQTNYSYDNSGRMLTEQVLVNGTVQADLAYSYDQLGRLSTKTYKKGSWSTQETISYNLRSWLTNQSSPYFSMKLNYETTESPNATKRYSGSISEWAWQQGSGVPQNLYQFDYDGVERLKKATQFSKSGSAWSPTSAHYVENGVTYDKNGNILTLQRTAAGSVVDNLSYTYTGNQLTGLTENVSSSASNDIFVRGANALGNYTYDVNGNMITDSRKNLQFEYNLLNLPREVKSGNVVKAKYVYTADGAKLQVRDGDATNGYDYAGSFVFKKNSSGLQLELINFSNGVIVLVGRSYQVNYFLRDHLGSARAVVDGTGAVKEQSDYYAFGSRQKRADYTVSENRYRYNGKELQTTGDLGYLDYGARMYMPEIGRWFNTDQLSEKNAQYTPYAYCYNNPINVIDPDGKDGIYITFPDYKISTPIGKIGGLGHAGVLLIDNKTGLTKYYEYGRYDKEKLGIVRTGNIPDVVIGKDGKPTEKSLEKTLSAISEKFGDGGRIEGAYVDSDKFEKMNDYAKSKKNENSNKERKKYSLMKNNCGAFAADVLNQDSDVKKKSPSIIDPKPTSIVEEFQEKFKKIEYDPNKNKKNK